MSDQSKVELLQGALRAITPLIEANPKTTISIHDALGVFLFVSEPVREVFGWLPEQLVGGSFYDLVHEEDLPRASEDHVRHMRERTGWLRYRLMRGDGHHEWVETRSRARTLADGSTYIVCITRPLVDSVEDPVEPSIDE